MRKTEIFTFGETTLKGEEIFKKMRINKVIHEFKDFSVVLPCEISSDFKPLRSAKEALGGTYSKFIEAFSESMGDVPTLSIRNYAEEMLKLGTKEIKNYRQLKRSFIEMEGHTTVASCIVIDKFKAYVMSEMYQDNTFIKAIQYDLEEVYKIYKGE